MERTILMVGDVIGQPGMRALYAHLPMLKKQHKADLCVVNGENAADGFGLTPDLAEMIFSAGADVITTGNHVWQQREIYRYLDEQPNILRPANYPSGNPGHGSAVVAHGGLRFGVLNLQGRQRMWPIDCPFKRGRDELRKLKSECDAVVIDFHADDPQEKEAIAYHFDGQATALVGTHTHIQTADERILPKGLAYLTDLGSTGPDLSIIGFDPEISIQRHLTDLPLRNEVSENPSIIQGAVITFDDAKPHRALSITRIREAAGV
jgi:metallophosphoesterase (TIGR00282 family)